MHMKKRVSVLLLATCLGVSSGALFASSHGNKAAEKAEDPKAAEAQAMIESAEKARKMAASVDGEWRDTGKFIKKAQAALKDGKLDQAMALAKKAEAEGRLGYEQAVSQKDLVLPSYFKVKATAPAAAAMAMPTKMHKITPELPSVDVVHQGEAVTVSRVADESAVIPKAYASTARECPPFCVQPMSIGAGIETVGELEVIEYLQRIAKGDPTVLVVDSRTPEWIVRGTVPGSVNIPWNKINVNFQGSFGTEGEVETLGAILQEQFHARKANGKWDFRNAKTLVMFCNGIWCPQSAANIRTLMKLGYPAYKLKWYRGGMQSWVSAGLTTVNK
jgi:rhodanese-related sulfurtransferase